MRLLYLFIFIFPFILSAQKSEAERYFDMQKESNIYKKSKQNKQIGDYYSGYPSALDQGFVYADKPDGFQDELQLTPEELSHDRQVRYGEGHGSGVLKKPNSEVVPPNPPEFPKVEFPDFDILPDIDLPDIDFPSFGTWEMWRTLLIIIVIIAILYLIYLFISRMQPRDAAINVEFESDFNPVDLEDAKLHSWLNDFKKSGDYRSSVRVLFLTVLKRLIEKNQIVWILKKTNQDYLEELKEEKLRESFSKCVRIYDLVWYGNYQLDENVFVEVESTFTKFLNDL